MFAWLKRRAQLGIIKSAEQDIDRFIASLRGADEGALSMIVAVATHWRHALAQQGIDLLDPVAAEAKDPFLAIKLNKLIAKTQKDDPAFAVGLMVWLHTLRAANIPEIRLKGRHMWDELSKGFEGVDEAGKLLVEMSGARLDLTDPARIPSGLEPMHRSALHLGGKKNEEFLKMIKAAAEGQNLAKIRQAIATITTDRLSDDETEMAGFSAAILAKAVTEATISRIDDDDDRFCAGMFAFVFADHFSRLAAGNFELAAFSAVLRTLGTTEFERCFNAIVTSHTKMVESKSNVILAIGNACNSWLEEPTRESFERLTKLFEVTRKYVTES